MRLFIPVILIFLMSACSHRQAQPVDPGVYYTCSMDPQVHELTPGNCPICKMRLTKVNTISAGDPEELKLSDQQVKLGNIKVDTIRNGSIQSNILLPGTVVADASSNQSISSRIMGRIDKLYFKIEGEHISKGDHLMEIYSEELNNARQEYLLLLEKKAALGTTIVDYDQLIAAAQNKLRLWGMTEHQVRELARTKQATSLVTIFSERDGVISSIAVREGDYVMQGSVVLSLTNLSKVWVEAQVYLTEAGRFKEGSAFDINVPGIDKLYHGSVQFINPEIGGGTRTNLLRLEVSNTDGMLKPGMPVYVKLNERSPGKMILPSSAVIHDRGMDLVWIASGDHRFRSRMIKVGEQSADQVQVLEGLQEGDRVVISGAWLLNSEYTLRNGSGVMAGHSGM